MTANPAYVSSAKAAAYYGVTTQTLRKWAKLGKIEHFKTPGGHHRFLLAGMPAKAAPAPAKPAPRREQAIAKAPPPKPDPAALRRQIDALAT
jgi:hypothetical protein